MKKRLIINHIVSWLKNYCDKSGMNGFVVGVSGGIDSALTSTLCALTNKPVFVLNMPILQDNVQLALSSEHILRLKKKYKNVISYDVDLTNVFVVLKESLPKEIQDDHSMANSRSRLRMLTLYTVATHHKMLVAGTGNKIEDFGVGFFTKYGDGGVDISPIADLLKSEVYALAEELEVIEGILKAAPVDGLWADNRTDEQQIGATYDELEKAMHSINSTTNRKFDKSTKREKEVVQIFKYFHRMNAHKMKPIPVCVVPKKFK